MVSEGDLWKRQRRMIQPSFNRNVIGKMFGQIVQANMLLLERWEDKATRGEKINLTEEVSDLILNIVLETIFSEDVGALISAAGDNSFAILTGESARNLQFAVKFRALAKLVGEIINQRRQANRLPFDFLAMLMASRDKQTGEPMNDKQLIDEVMTLIVAGHETTASALNWAWYLLSKHSDVEGQLHEEVDSLPAEQMDTIDGLAKLDYTKQVIEETLRLYPPGWFLTRRTVAEDEIRGHYLAPKTDVIICPYLVHRHPEFWEEPEVFRPERFAASASGQRHRFAYFPFAIGPRHCVGEFLAMVEMQIHLCLVAQKFKLKYIPDYPIELEAQVNLRSKHPFYMSLEKRHV
jgi:cytochrome P450